MIPAPCDGTTPVPSPAYQRAVARHRSGLHAGPAQGPRVYSDASLLLIALLRTLWRLSLRDMPGTRARVLLVAWPATMSKGAAAGAPPYEVLFVEAVRQALRTRLIGARDLIIDSAPITAGRRADPDAGYPRTGVARRWPAGPLSPCRWPSPTPPASSSAWPHTTPAVPTAPASPNASSPKTGRASSCVRKRPPGGNRPDGAGPPS